MTNAEMLSMALPMLAVVVALIIVASTLKEGHGDERDSLHRMMASRAAFILGLIVLSAGTIYQTFTHSIDPWLIGALIAVTLGKIIGLIIGNRIH